MFPYPPLSDYSIVNHRVVPRMVRRQQRFFVFVADSVLLVIRLSTLSGYLRCGQSHLHSLAMHVRMPSMGIQISKWTGISGPIRRFLTNDQASQVFLEDTVHWIPDGTIVTIALMGPIQSLSDPLCWSTLLFERLFTTHVTRLVWSLSYGLALFSLLFFDNKKKHFQIDLAGCTRIESTREEIDDNQSIVDVLVETFNCLDGQLKQKKIIMTKRKESGKAKKKKISKSIARTPIHRLMWGLRSFVHSRLRIKM